MTQGNEINTEIQVFDAMENSSIDLPDHSAFADMEMSRDGQDLVLQSEGQSDIVIENYFTAEPAPVLQSADGSVLTPELVDAFVQSPAQFASIETAAGTEAEAIGAIEELQGSATVTHLDGTSEPITLGTPIYEGDVIQTAQDGAVNILFIDETSMALSEGARFAVTDYSYDEQTESGTTDFSVLRGVFVFTSGLIGRDDPDDVTIDTPVGSIGIRGTIIAGHINPEGESSITVIEGAIVVKNATGETTLSEQYETVHINGFNSDMQEVGVLEPQTVTQAYGSASYVIPSLFSNLNDAAEERAAEEEQVEEALEAAEEAIEEEIIEETPEEILEQPQEILIEQPLNDSLDFQTMEETSDYKPLLHKLNNLDKPTFDDLSNPDVIAASNTPEFSIANRLTENEIDGGIAAKLIPTQPGTKFFFLNNTDTSTDGNFQIIGNNVVLTTAGHGALTTLISGMTATGLNSNQAWGHYAIRAIDSDGQVVTHAFDPIIRDIAVNLNGSGHSLPHDAGWVNVGDVNDDGNDDYADINGAYNAVISDTPSSGSSMHIAANGPYSSLASVGDLNNDGYNNVIAGRSSNPGGGAVDIIGYNGAAYNDGIIAPPGGVGTGDNYGASVAGIGAFDNGTVGHVDGMLDYIVGATGTNGGMGSAFIHSSQYGALEITGVNASDQIGHFVDGIGDVSGDGLSDVLIGGNNINEAYIFYGGRNTGTSVANADVTINVGGGNYIIDGSSAGDFNGDGFDDFAISVANGGANVQTFVVFGSGSTPTDIDMAYLEDPNNAFKINDVSGFNSAYTVQSVGDLNGDGFDDIQVGSIATGFHTIHGGLNGNAPYVTDGATNDLNPTVGNVRASAHGQAMVNGRNFYDNNFDNLSIVGNSQNNTITVTDETFRNIDAGSGMDTLRYGTAAGSLDFTNINYEQVSGLERLQYSQDGATILLTVENIFNLLKTSDTGELKIELDGANGVTSGTLDIDAAGTYASTATGVMAALDEQGSIPATHTTVTDATGTYDQYNIGGYTLYIDNNITTAVV